LRLFWGLKLEELYAKLGVVVRNENLENLFREQVEKESGRLVRNYLFLLIMVATANNDNIDAQSINPGRNPPSSPFFSTLTETVTETEFPALSVTVKVAV